MAANWSLKGTYFESCNCDNVCPCIFLRPPSQGYCQAFVAWHIDDGHVDDVQLAGLNVAAWLHSPGELTGGNWRLALYVDSSAKQDQHDALVKVYTGELGGHPAVLASFVAELMGVKSVPIEYAVDGKQRSLTIPDVGSIEMLAIDGEDGGDVLVTNHPLAVSPSNPVAISESKRLRYHDYGVDWLHSGTAGLSAPFAYQA